MHCRLYDKLGAHPARRNKQDGTEFRVWAPNASRVSVIGGFNDWSAAASQSMTARDDGSGIWETFIEGVAQGTAYKFHIESAVADYAVDKADPYARAAERAPGTASLVWNAPYRWQDEEWMRRRREANALSAPISIYEVHLGSWRRHPEQGNRSLTYRELAEVAACLCARPGLHARRVVAGDGAPLLRFLGVPVHRLLRADIALRYAGRPQGTDRCPARAWHRCDTRLGPVALPQRRTRTCLLRRHASVRARRRASGLSPGVEELHLQLRPPRSAGVPGVERSVLARRVSCRRTQSRCRRIHALP